MTISPPAPLRSGTHSGSWAPRRPGGSPLVLVAHGSRDPRSASAIRRLAARVGPHWPAPVTACFLDFNEPSVPDVLRRLAAGPNGPPTVVPCLLTSAYHDRVDVPEALAAAAVPTRLAGVLGPDPLVVAALRRRLSELDVPYDGVVLNAAGTSHAAARSTVEAAAAMLGAELDVPCLAGYASASAPTPARALVALRARGATRIVAVSYFLAPGRLFDDAAASARSAGAVGVAAPLGQAPEIVRLVLARAAAAVPVAG